MIEYIHGNLFENTKDVLLHACNCRRCWGAGIAADFAKKFPKSYAMHQNISARRGTAQILKHDKQPIICLFTSKRYGWQKDSPDEILLSTKRALDDLAQQLHGAINIASPKINAGLFQVPWEDTEVLIEQFLAKNPRFTWKVYYL